MYLEINPQEKRALDRVLTRYLSELQKEIQHTDSRDYKDGLKYEEGVLSGLRNRLEWDRDEANEGLS